MHSDTRSVCASCGTPSRRAARVPLAIRLGVCVACIAVSALLAALGMLAAGLIGLLCALVAALSLTRGHRQCGACGGRMVPASSPAGADLLSRQRAAQPRVAPRAQRRAIAQQHVDLVDAIEAEDRAAFGR